MIKAVSIARTRIAVWMARMPRSRSLREKSFWEVWDTAAVFESFRRLRIHSCEDCRRFDQCHGGCPAVAYHLGRGVAGGDPECLIHCVRSLGSDATDAGRFAGQE